MKNKIAIVNQRYGTEVNGGSEYYTKKLAEHLKDYYDVEVLTTTALDYDTWTPYYLQGTQIVDGVKVRRFAVKRPRNVLKFKLINKLVKCLPLLWKKILEPVWIKAQGPYCPELVKYLKQEKNNYDVFIFVTYLYYTTVAGLPAVADKSIFIPTAHDEYRVAGSGIDIYDDMNESLFREKYNIDFNYAIYVGRVDTSKKCDELFSYFSRFTTVKQNDLKLVVVGKMMIAEPEDERIHCLGFISEEEKCSAIAGARLLIMPSEHESLSLVVLEAMSMGVPVLVNGVCEVLEGHCIKSKAGISYKSFEQFENGLEFLLDNEEEYQKMQIAGKRYVRENYSWNKTVEKYIEMIEL